MPKIALPGCWPKASFDRSAHLSESRIARSASSCAHGSLTHSSNCIWMSDPRRRWTSIDRSGVSSCREPSICDWKTTPRSLSFRSLARLITWKPPESVRIGCGPVHEPVQAAERGDPLRSGRQHQMVGVAEHDIVAERPHRVRRHGLHRRGGADGHEGRRANDAARSRDGAKARSPVGRVHGEGELGAHVFSPGAFADGAAEQQAGVAIRIKAIAGLNGVRVSGAHRLKSAESRDEHEQRRSRQDESWSSARRRSETGIPE